MNLYSHPIKCFISHNSFTNVGKLTSLVFYNGATTSTRYYEHV